MPNSDNTYGTFNKKTFILTQAEGIWTMEDITVDGVPSKRHIYTTVEPQIFADVSEAKSWFFTDDALTVFDECCTEIQWALVNPHVGAAQLKCTMAFGTKGSPTQAAADDWAEQYRTRSQTLIDAGNWNKNPLTTEDSEDHLF